MPNSCRIILKALHLSSAPFGPSIHREFIKSIIAVVFTDDAYILLDASNHGDFTKYIIKIKKNLCFVQNRLLERSVNLAQ